MKLGPRIRRLRLAKKLNQAQLARRVGVVRSTVHAWENNRAVPGIKRLKLIAFALDEPAASKDVSALARLLKVSVEVLCESSFEREVPVSKREVS